MFATTLILLNSTDSSSVENLRIKNPSKFVFGGGKKITKNVTGNQQDLPEKINEDLIKEIPDQNYKKYNDINKTVIHSTVNKPWFLENLIKNINVGPISFSKEQFRIAMSRKLLERFYFVNFLNNIFEKKSIIIEDSFINSPIGENLFYHILQKQKFIACDPTVKLTPKEKFYRFMDAFESISFEDYCDSTKSMFISQFCYVLAINLDSKLKDIAAKYIDINSEETKELFMQEKSNEEFFKSFLNVSDDIVTRKIMNIFIDSFSVFKKINDDMLESGKKDDRNRYRIPGDELHLDPYVMSDEDFDKPFISKNNHPPYNHMFLFILQKMCFGYRELIKTSHLDMLSKIYGIDFSEAVGDYMRDNICEKNNYKISFSRVKGQPYKMEVRQGSELDGTFFNGLMKILFGEKDLWIHNELYLDKSYENLANLVAKNEDKYVKLFNLSKDKISNDGVILAVTTMYFVFNELDALYNKNFSNVCPASLNGNSDDNSKDIVEDNLKGSSVEYINLENTFQTLMNMMDLGNKSEDKSENSTILVRILINSFNFLLNENKKQGNIPLAECNVSAEKMVDYATSELKLDNVYSKVFACVTYVFYSFLKDIKLYGKIPPEQVSGFINDKIKEHVLSQASKSLKNVFGNGSDTE